MEVSRTGHAHSVFEVAMLSSVALSQLRMSPDVLPKPNKYESCGQVVRLSIDWIEFVGSNEWLAGGVRVLPSY